MTLYEIDQKIYALQDAETGEILDYEAFEKLQMDRERKIENTALWVKELLAEAEAIQEEVKALQERQRRNNAKAERLKGYLERALAGMKFTTPRCEVTFCTTSSLYIEDATRLLRWAEENGYDHCIRYREPEIDKLQVKKLMKSGVEVPGGAMVTNRSVGVK